MNMANIFFLCFLFWSWFFNTAVAAEKATIPVNVGVVVDVDAPKHIGKIYLSCIEMALNDFYASRGYFKTRLVLNTRNSNQTVVGAASAALDLMKNVEVQAILGPMTSMQASFVVNLGEKAHVPILSFSATSPCLASIRSPYFFLMTQADSDQVKAIRAIVKNFGWRQVVPIYVDNTYGEGVIPFLVDALQEIDVHVPYRSAISASADDDQIHMELNNLISKQTRVFVVHMLPDLSSRLFAKAKELGMMSKNYVWIMTNGVGNRLWSMSPGVLNLMQGVLGVETDVPRTSELTDFKRRWRRRFQQDNPDIIDGAYDMLALRAYDATFALAFAVEEVGNTSLEFLNRNGSFNATDLGTLKVSQNGRQLADALSITRFKGIAGEFSLHGRQLQPSNFKIFNVSGDGVRTIAFWTPKNGLVRPIVWPGDSYSIPKGWEIPTRGKKLRIGVPAKQGFTEFVKVTRNLSTNKLDVTGFSIDVFRAAVDALPYDLPHEFIPFGGTYNDLVYQVFLGVKERHVLK